MGATGLSGHVSCSPSQTASLPQRLSAGGRHDDSAGTRRQVAAQQEPVFPLAFPASHCSPDSTTPFPHARHPGTAACMQPVKGSQVSLVQGLLSSHSSSPPCVQFPAPSQLATVQRLPSVSGHRVPAGRFWTTSVQRPCRPPLTVSTSQTCPEHGPASAQGSTGRSTAAAATTRFVGSG